MVWLGLGSVSPTTHQMAKGRVISYILSRRLPQGRNLPRLPGAGEGGRGGRLDIHFLVFIELKDACFVKVNGKEEEGKNGGHDKEKVVGKIKG